MLQKTVSSWHHSEFITSGQSWLLFFFFSIYFANQLEQLRKHYLMEIRKQQLILSQYVHYLREVLARGQIDHNLEMCVDGGTSAEVC